MKILLKLFAALCLMALTSAISLAAAETVDLGSVRISMDLQNIGPYNVQKENPSSSNHNYGGYAFAYQSFPVTITVGSTGSQVLVGVYQLSVPEPLDTPIPMLNGETGLEHAVEKSGMMPPGRDVQKQPYYIDGYKGLAFIANGGQKGPIYLVAYSPDMKDGFGKTVVIIGSNLPLDTTKSIFESVKILSAQEGIVGQSNTGMGNTVQSNTGQNNMGQSNMGTISQSNMGTMNQSNMGQSDIGQSSEDMINMMKMSTDIMQYLVDTGQGNTSKSSIKMGGMKMGGMKM